MMNGQLSHIFSDSWNKLMNAGSGDESLTRNITVCNYAAGYVNAYTVVLRESSADDYTLLFYTDIRSEKVKEIEQDNHLTIIIYDDARRLQLILKGTAVIHHQNKIAQLYWDDEGHRNRWSYMARPAPSTVVNEPVNGLEHLNGKSFDEDDNSGYENFAVVQIEISYLEWLQLSREGNSRARFIQQAAEWQGMWLVP